MSKSKVAIVRCDNYNEDTVKEAVLKGINLLGGASCFVRPGENILLKPNVLVGSNPDKCVTTHPSVFKAVAEIFKNEGANISYGDSPAVGKAEWSYKQSGLKKVADELDIKTADFQTVVKVPFPEALLAPHLTLAAGVIFSDGIISLSKMKSHGFTRITGAVKNQFGCIPGLLKAEYHVKVSDISEFSKLLVDINRFLQNKLRLFIMDGVIAMEGNGPRGGDPTPMNVLLFSTDPVALDATFCDLVNLNPEFVPTMKPAFESGLGTYKSNQIETVGDAKKALINKNFKVVRLPADRLASVKQFPPFLKKFISTRPYIIDTRCTKCGTCVQICPVNPKALNWTEEDKNKDKSKGRKPVYNYDRCIRCYCCQELCPEKAIKIKIPLLARLIRR